jgi:phage head maturation protease
MSTEYELRSADLESVIEVRDEAKREIGIRIVPFDVVADTVDGPEVWERGSTAHLDPSKIVLRMDHQNPPAGKGFAIEHRDDGTYVAFRVSRTQRGDEILALALDGVATGASVGFDKRTSVVETRSINGRRTRVVKRGDVREVSTTWLPTWSEASVQYIRSAEEEPVSEPTPETPAAVDLGPLTEAIANQTALIQRSQDSLGERIAAIEERSRQEFVIPPRNDDPEVDLISKRGDWMSYVLKSLSGERVPDVAYRELADLVTADNLGVVPDAFSSEIIGVIDPRRPFLQTTRRLALPPSGMSLVVPKIVTRPTAAVQARFGDESFPEKSDVDSTATSITNESFDAITIAGGGDISIQLLKRSSPSYLSLFLELLAEAYASEAEDEALAALIATVGGSGMTNGGTLDPEDLTLGDAWAAGAAVKKPIDTMWLSSAGVSGFIDAKASGTNAPLYSNIQSGFTAGSGPAGTISGLRPVYVPALDATSYDVIVGPSDGFGWTEDGTYTLQVDVPAKAGRDVALVGIVWFAPMYPTAFTAYAIAGS